MATLRANKKGRERADVGALPSLCWLCKRTEGRLEDMVGP